ncbi:MAG: tRNA (adenosine(37)-N6)-threonylcarbamoyltransferase complex transferase subunit TsaD [Epulopiscium sp.]|nr:tRNA (adenosine(37)-N6)-threonylcarbamoyltransferase complex transferase subunit TsaD [Candidatus Epulonipiscium sp.]
MPKQQDVYILAIETSCDETAAAVVKDGTEVLSNIISSQIDLHKKYGGVVPEIASRKHMEKINPVIQEAMEKAGLTFKEIDAIAVTYGPGLVGALLVGLSAAKGLAFALKKPLIGIHHIEGHISANYINNPNLQPPFICLVVSGGHSHLVHVKDYGEYEILGKTRDDAAGEAFDKVARSLGLSYPGGPEIDRLAKEGDSQAIIFPRSYLEEGSYDFSFSGIKSAVLNHINQCKMKDEKIHIQDVAASFQDAVTDVLVEKTIQAAKQKQLTTIVMAGGVAANQGLRQKMQHRCQIEGFSLEYPPLILCTDNAAMIGAAAYHEYKKGVHHGWDLNAVPNLKLGEKIDVSF